ncbi:MAG: prolipoprotein diacylglyceryl transferase [Erysipelotrichaceae bacterium]|nr:prolipoprotein diacylglyceryl transferase [Erysipelotrichaceae bacterium]
MIQFFPNAQTFVLFKIGPLTFDIRWYAVLIMTGALLAYFLSRKEMKESRYVSMDFYDSLFIYTLWVGVMGARLWYCVFYNFSYYFSKPFEIIRIWDGGLAIQGGIVFGALFAYWYTRRQHYPFMKFVDMILPNVMLAQAIGRWGNFVNKECHGGEVAESYFNGILSFLKEGMLINGHYYEPLFFYESMLCLLGWYLIHFVLRKHQNKRGDLAYAYLMWYGVIRFFIEGRRTDSLYLGNLKMAQVTSVLFVIIGLLGYLGFFNRYLKKEKPTLMFDFDGTLVDTSKAIQEGYRALFEKYSDVSLFTEEVKQKVLGPALKDLFPIYFPGLDYDMLYEDYHKRQFEVAPVLNQPMPNAVEVLKQLHEEGYHIGVISTRTNDGIIDVSKPFGLDEYFDDICGLTDVKNLKPDPEGIINMIEKNGWNKECVMIGDSMMDIGCGKNYGAFTVAYVNNPNRVEELSAAANRSIKDLKDLLPILQEDIAYTWNEK